MTSTKKAYFFLLFAWFLADSQGKPFVVIYEAKKSKEREKNISLRGIFKTE